MKQGFSATLAHLCQLSPREVRKQHRLSTVSGLGVGNRGQIRAKRCQRGHVECAAETPPCVQSLFGLQALGGWGAAVRRGLGPALAAGLRRGLLRGLGRGGRPRRSQPHWYSAKRRSAPIWSAYSAISRPLPPIRGGRIGWTGLSPSGTPIKEEGESSTTTRVSNETSGAIASSSFKWWMALGSGSSKSTSKESR